MSEQGQLLESLKRVTIELRETRERLSGVEAKGAEPIAIVGMSCSYPGGVSNPEELWQLLAEGRDAISPFPSDRGWDLENLYDPNPDNLGTSYVREGGFVDDAAGFDAEFFGISPKEALATDPQQRLLLEAAWEALESAGIDPLGLRGSDAGVFAGVMATRESRSHGAEDSGGYGITGASASVVSGRIAYALGLEGPAVSLDTACSSSLVALHLASHALRTGECRLALAGGVTVLAGPSPFVEFSRQRGLAPDGRCKSFAEAADGTAWSEGAGLLVLERLSEAERNGHRVLATIRGSAVNQDGASNGLTAPNGPSQERVIRQALANAGLSPSDVDAVEAHGTGTALGDPIEAGAILATYGQGREGKPLYLGSLKSNIGHTQAAAGVGGVIKTVMAMRHGVLPRTLHVDEPTSHVDWEAGEVELLTESVAWQRNGRPRRAGVSSFGVSGTNAHLILEEPPAPAPDPEPSEPPLPAVPLLLSAKSEPALASAAARLATRLEADSDLDPADVALALAGGRAQLSHRAAVIGAGRGELLEGLRALAAGEPHSGLIRGRATAGKLAFMLTGQGAQRPGMGAGLYAAFPAYAQALDRVCEEIDPHLGLSLKAHLFAEPGSPEAEALDRTELTQPALLATEVALFGLLESLGLRPDFLIGHSIGELAAAHLSGVLSLPDACALVAARGALMGALPEDGAMVAIEASEAELVAQLPAGLSIAAINDPTSVVVSGEAEAAEAFASGWSERGRKTRRLRVSHAFHSELMEPMLAEFGELAAGLDFSEPTIPIVSNLTGLPLTPEQATSPEYWVRQVREPVRFAAGIDYLREQGVGTFLELGPDGVLCAMAQASLGQEQANPTPLLRKDRPEAAALLGALAQAHTAGVQVDWAALFTGRGQKRVELPTYPFQRSRYWPIPGGGRADATALGQAATEHPLLGATTALAGQEQVLLCGRLSLRTHPWLADHVVHGTAIVPGTAFLEMALRAGEEVGLTRVEELTLQAPLPLPAEGGVALQVRVGAPAEDGTREVEIHSRPEGEEDAEWALHAIGSLAVASGTAVEPEPKWPPRGAEGVPLADFYDVAAGLGVEYGPAFQGVRAAWRRGNELFAEIEPAELSEPERYLIHPGLLDAAIQPGTLDSPAGGLRVPFSWRGVELHRAGAAALRARLRTGEGGALSLDLADESGSPLLAVEALALRPLDPSQLRAVAAGPQSLFALRWVGVSPASSPESRILEFPPDRGLDPLAATRELCERGLAALQEAIAAGQRLTIVSRGGQAVAEDEVANPAAAALWGLVRSAQAEHPGLFTLIDLDEEGPADDELAALSLGASEPQLAVRDGVLLAPRLVAAATEAEEKALPLDPEATVLVTGATGGIGSLLARHLVEVHGTRRLLLVSRSGSAAAGAAELEAELRKLGAEVEIRACDVGDREALRELLAEVPAEHPLGAVFHCAGALDDGVIQTLDPERLDRVLAPKADAAWHLHELTAGAPLTHFVLFSSIAGTLNTPGQGNYAAANAFLDALARRRRAEGLPALSLGWGGWEGSGGMLSSLDEAGRARLLRGGVLPFGEDEGLALFDRALTLDSPHLLPVALDRGTLRDAARAGSLSPLLAGLVKAPVRAPAPQGSLAARLVAVPAAEREGVAVVVRSHVAAVLGHSGGEAVEPERAFKDLGFDSLAAVELRNRLGQATGLQLPATLVFDYPSSAAVAGFLLAEVEGVGSSGGAIVAHSRNEEPIAIVGMSCRYPGAVGSPEQLWELVERGTDAISGFPADRGWDLERLYDPDPDHPATSYVREGGFLADAADFDAEFFGISPKEALATDPQQRLLLEAAWEALEAAGIDLAQLRGTPTGVFAGVMYHDYARGSAPLAGGHAAPDPAGSIVSGRISYALGLEGPAVSVDTACSSSLVAMHLAAQALRSGECSLALAGGVAVMATPATFVEFSRQRGLAPDGRCKSFAEAADGTAWAEGAGLLVLERLSEAERNGHRVLATIRGSAVNQDGASNGLTAPNGPSQERVIRQALANAGLSPSDVDAVEAHGTGTALGDPIEAGAILATYGQGREGKPLYLGSLKSNIGHAQAAAGVGGVIKTVMAMRHGVLPKTLHVDEPSSHVNWQGGEVELLREPVTWQPNGRPRRAGVSSFGVSGTNAHLILEEPPAPAPDPEPSEPPLPAVPLLLSAKSEPALASAAARLATRLKADPELDPADVALSLAGGRAQLSHRAAVIGADHGELLEGLRALASGEPHPGLIRGRATGATKVAFVFPGQGAQWQGMALELIESAPAFAAQMRACEQALAPFLDFSLADALAGAEGAPPLQRLEVVQPALFAVMVSLAALWRAHGIEPAAVVGHSQGELAAAHVAGALSLEDAARVVALRAKALDKVAGGAGGMVSVALGAERVEALIEPWQGRLSLAAFNSPASTVVSGDPEALAELLATCEREGHRARAVAVDYASHSPQVEELREEILAALAPISPQAAEIPFYSTLTGEPLDGTELGAEYWYRNLREPVRFQEATRALLAAGFGAFVEVSPHPVLGLAVEESAEAADRDAIATIATLRRDEGGLERFLTALATAHVAGVALDWQALFAGRGQKRVELPTYPFQRSRYWLEPNSGSADAAAIGQSATEHPLLGAATSLAGQEQVLLSGRLSLRTHPWIGDHVVHGVAIVPGTAFLEMALRAGEEVGLTRVEELTLQAPLPLSAEGGVALQVGVGAPAEDGNRPVEIHSRPEGEEDAEWALHAIGSLGEASAQPPAAQGEWPPAGAEAVEVTDFYEQTAGLGVDFGPSFQGVRAVWRRGSEFFVESDPSELSDTAPYTVHPARMDAAMHALFLQEEAAAAGPRVPFVWRGVTLHGEGKATLRTRMSLTDEEVSYLVSDEVGAPIFSVDSLTVRQIDGAKLVASISTEPRSLFALRWVEVAPAENPEQTEVETLELLPDPDPDLDPAAAAKELCGRGLTALQEAIASGERLTILTRGAQAVGEDESPDPAGAALWGLVRSAQAEHPGLFTLIDLDAGEPPPALTAATTEPQLAVRAGVLLAPRLAGAEADGDEEAAPLDPERTVLLTGATGGIGSLLARHLVERHGARHLLLVSRSGPEAEGAAELEAELRGLGAEVEIGACDVGDRAQLEGVLARVDPEHPLGAVVHCAATFDNGLIEALDPERLDRVLAPKADAAWHLHELTAVLPLTHFVLFSSVAGTFNNPGQGNYAAANAFLDALAHRRRRQGLPATAAAWGLWERGQEEGDERLGELDMERLARDGHLTMSRQQALALFDRVLTRTSPFLLASPLDMAALRARGREGTLPPLFSGLVRVRAPRQAAAGSRLADRLASLPEAEREQAVVDLVRAEAAAVLGHSSSDALDPRRSFRDAGFDSLGAVELRNRLTRATGQQLPATVVFDYPSAAALGEFLFGSLEGERLPAPVVVPATSPTDEPIAIVGMSCRYPGASSPGELWELLVGGGEAISPFPDDRGWDLERLYDPDPDTPGTSHVRVGGFLDDVAGFDAEFFGISPKEALATDPQQRLLLEATWEALESAGIDPEQLRGGDSGVFAGVMPDSYGVGAANTAGIDGYGVSASGSVVSGRIAYALGLEGPAVSVDTACSSSLVAIHLAAQALRAGECGLVLAGGVTAFVTPGMLIEFSRMRALAGDGRCKAFAAAADGTGLSEGAGLLVLERLSEAEANGHRVLATIRGSAVNQDGASNGLTAPNGPSQERVIRQALANAGLSPADVDAVEAHGTGTALGDPIEAGAILATYGQGREGRPLYLGSLKSNIGHAQAAAGVGGVIKTVMAMRHEELPRTLHVDEPTSHVDWEAGEVELLTESRAWQRGERSRRAGVSAFGMSGTNAHLILEEGPAPEPAPAPSAPALPAVPLLLSAKSEPALAESAARLATCLAADPDLDPLQLAAALAGGRAALEHRAAVIGAGREELLEGLRALAAGEPHSGLIRGRAGAGKLAFMLTGQGAQRPGMGAGLYAAFPAYAQALDRVCEEIDPHLGLSLKAHLFAEPGSPEAEALDRTELTQPALLATEVALFGLLESLGLRPDFLIGHSIGELAAAHLSGVLSLPDACALVAARGALMGALPQGGAMVAIEASEAELVAQLPAGLSIAAINDPTSVVVSGEAEAAEAFASGWSERGRKTRRLRVSHAFHSELMEPMLEELAELAAGLSFAAPQIPIVSNLTGLPLTPEQATSPEYWVRQVREPVRFAAGIDYLREQGVGTYLELGPDGVLCAMAQASLGQEQANPTPLLRKGRPEAAALLGALAQAHCEGASVDWEALLGEGRALASELPTYPFQRSRYWLEPNSGSADAAAIGQSATEHPLLGAATSLAGQEQVLLSGRLSLRTHPWIGDHVVHGVAIVPGTAFLEMALRAGEEVGLTRVEELTLQAPLPLSAEGGVALQVGVGAPAEDGNRPVEIHSRPEGEEDAEWALHAIGSLGEASAQPPAAQGEWPPAGAEAVEVESLYDLAAGLEVEYGPSFGGLGGAWRRECELFGEAAAGALADADSYAVHPALLDTALQVGLLEQDGAGDGPRVPFAWHGVELHRAGASTLRAHLSYEDEGAISLALADEAGAPVLSVESLVLREIDPAALRSATEPRSLFVLRWTEVAVPERAPEQTEVETLELLPDPDLDLDPAAAAKELCGRGLTALQEAIASGERLTILTRGAQAVGEESPDPAGAALWGLVRSAQAEHPGLFALIDLDEEGLADDKPAALSLGASEPQLAVRGGALLAPRLAGAEADGDEEAAPLDPERTVLLTGATGGIGSLLARHLVERHGARHLLLVSRSGPAAEGAAELEAELRELGAEVEIGACDVGDRAQLEGVLARVDPEHPLGAVFHVAGTIDDGLVSALDPERLDRVLAPKADAAWHLHELTAAAPLTHFVLFSSVAGTFNNPGQGNYAAANAFLDALAHRRRRQGLPALSLGWGAWASRTAMTAALGEADRARLTRAGIAPLSEEEGLALLDRSLRLATPHLLPAALDRGALRAAARAGALPPLFSGLVKGSLRAPVSQGSLASRLAAVPEAERQAFVTELVRSHVATVLGHASAEAVDSERAFKELGFDSLAAVELRNRLGLATGLRLPASLVFDYPNPAALGAFLVSLVGGEESAEPDVEGELKRLEATLTAIAPERRRRFRARLQDLLLAVSAAGEEGEGPVRAEADLESVSDDELFQLIDRETL